MKITHFFIFNLFMYVNMIKLSTRKSKPKNAIFANADLRHVNPLKAAFK